MQIVFSYELYVRAHGRNPRGVGHWGFHFTADAGEATEFAEPNLTFTQARLWAVRRARRYGAHTIEVCA